MKRTINRVGGIRLFYRFAFLPFSLFALMLMSCGTAKKTQDKEQAAVAIMFNADSAYAFCQQQCDFGPRTMNSEAHERCARWLKQKFEQYGCEVYLQQADLRGYDGTVLKSTNIIAQRKENANGTRPRILLCAHWDSRPWADNDPDSANWRKPVMAANDGASGVAVMLELARLMQQHDSLRVGVDFVCFDAEDWGVPQWSDEVDADSWALGAQYWAENTAPLVAKNYRYAVLLDMVGGQGARFYREGYSMQYAKRVVEKVWQAASAAGYGSFFPSSDGVYITDDHLPVNEKAHIPCIDIIPYYPDCDRGSFGPTWHTVNDDMQHIDRTTLKAVGQTLVQLLYSE